MVIKDDNFSSQACFWLNVSLNDVREFAISLAFCHNVASAIYHRLWFVEGSVVYYDLFTADEFFCFLPDF